MYMLKKTRELEELIARAKGYGEGDFIEDREGRLFLLCEQKEEKDEGGVSIETWVAVYFEDIGEGYNFELKEIEAVLEYEEYAEVLEVYDIGREVEDITVGMAVLQGFLGEIKALELLEDRYWNLVTDVWSYLDMRYLYFEKERVTSGIELNSNLVEGLKLGLKMEFGVYCGVYITNVLLDLEEIGLGQNYLTEDLIAVDERMVDIYEGEDLTDEEYDEKEYFLLESYIDTMTEEDIIEHIKRGLKEQE